MVEVEKEIRLVLVGDSGVGKTKLINRFINNNFTKVMNTIKERERDQNVVFNLLRYHQRERESTEEKDRICLGKG